MSLRPHSSSAAELVFEPGHLDQSIDPLSPSECICGTLYFFWASVSPICKMGRGEDLTHYLNGFALRVHRSQVVNSLWTPVNVEVTIER